MTFEEIKAKWFDLTHFTTDYDSVDRLHFADKYIDILLEIAEAAKHTWLHHDVLCDDHILVLALKELEKD